MVGEEFAARGYEVFSIDYRPGVKSVTDVLNRYRQIRRTRRKVCIWGDSAGGQLAMMTAELAGNVTCVIDEAGPTDLATLGGSPTRDVALASARAAFGHQLRRYSPLRHPWPKQTPLTLMYARYDPLVDISQGRKMARHSGGRLLVLGRGNAPFIHSTVSLHDLNWANNVMFNRVAQAMSAVEPQIEVGADGRRLLGRAAHVPQEILWLSCRIWRVLVT